MKYISLFLFLVVSSPAWSQTGSCVDSLRQPDTYYPCSSFFEPVCGCDNVTYRNECAAFWWGGITSWTYAPSACTQFKFDFYPTAISYFPAKFALYMKEPGSAVFYIYDVFGKLYYQRNFIATYNDYLITDVEIPVQNLPLGIYTAITIVGNEKQYIKFAKVYQFK